MDITEHSLKTWPEQFQAVKQGIKRHEVRKNDRNFQVGDILHLREYNPALQSYTGDRIVVMISYITPGGSFGLPDDMVVMTIVDMSEVIHA